VLPQPGKVHEAKVDELNVFFFAEFEDVGRSHEGFPEKMKVRGAMSKITTPRCRVKAKAPGVQA